MSIDIAGIDFYYGAFQALDAVDLSVPYGSVVAVVGPNGAGKSTLLRCIDGILAPSAGSITIDGTDTRTMSRADLSRAVSFLPQSTRLGFSLSVLDVVLMGEQNDRWWPKKDDVQKAYDALATLSMEGFALHEFNAMSGGQQQKVLLARAFASQRPILLLDEPTSNLDIRCQIEALKALKNYVHDDRRAAVVAIHDLNLASRFSDVVVIMVGGRVYAVGRPSTVITEGIIRAVYGIETKIIEYAGRAIVVPLDVGNHTREVIAGGAS